MKLALPKRANVAPGEAALAKPELAVSRIKTSKITNTMRLSRRARFVLDIGDDGTILVYYKAGAVQGRWFASDASPENIDVFQKALATDTNAPVLILLDTIDQTYSQQNLPPVSKMNLGGLLKRRIRREFGDIPLKGSYLLGKSDSKEWEFMLYAIEQSETVEAWINFVLMQNNRPAGIRVMPLEMTSLIETSYRLYCAKRNILSLNDCQWKFIVSHNKVSGFRQVITRSGKMVFTRLGQPLEGGADVQAGMIEQEISSTIEYLKRIGLKSVDDLHLHVIASEDIIRIIDLHKLGLDSKMMTTPYDLSVQFGWENICEEEDRFADIFLSIFALANKKTIANLWTKPLEKFKKLHMVRPYLRGAGALIAIAALGYTGFSGYTWWEKSEKVDNFRNQIKQSDTEIAELKAAVNMPPEELEKILDLYDLYIIINKQTLAPESFMNHLSQIFKDLPDDMLVQEVVWEETAASDAAAAPPANPAGTSQPIAPDAAPVTPPPGTPMPVKGSLNIDITVPSNIKGDALQERAQGVINKIQPAIPFYTFSLSEVPGAKNVNDAISIDLNAPIEQTDQMNAVTLKTTFTGTEYIPEPTIKNAVP